MRDGSEREYVEYVTARLPALRRLAYSLCGDEHQADDLVQEAVTKLYLSWAKSSRANSLDAWVRVILVRVFLDSQRKGWWKVRLFGMAPDVRASVDQPTEDRTVLHAALARVPPRQRAVLVLRYLHDLPVNEVAEVLGCSAGTVKSQTSHGLKALRRLLGDQDLAGAVGGSREAVTSPRGAGTLPRGAVATTREG
ncbi:SigE family RNA polymerase sigma factor [Micromonospora sp. NBC_01796]|uniref:SigE family RNA polymerase sigma factor n=1 Tax=Micromonospora sp. NBC_01796 TaxID=2975987 RepID=UPI002DD846AA|nr:SigE family RNA polymerase sigma factor [Micromonospora sp. NBC_01796]WSA87937.1 SigE family RNA polymerase sigma factor [Micromonospora sp. NBC_01796]